MTAREQPASPRREVAAVLTKLGVIGFGGPAAHIALMRDEAVVRRKWVTDHEFLDLLGAASALPGPTSTQLSMLLSKRRAGWSGLLIGGMCFIAPAMVIVLALAVAYVHWGTTVTGAGLLYGIKPIVIAIVVHALLGLAPAATRGRALLVLGTLASLLAYLLGASVLLVLVSVAVVVALVENARRVPPRLSAVVVPPALLGAAGHARPAPKLVSIFLEFLKLGAVVFGSGYVLLAFLRRDLVTGHHWISNRQLLDAVAVGQFTPGPVFTTATFVGYLIGGTAGALLATLAIFLPSFVMMMALAPVVPRLRASPWTAPLLDGLNAAAVGLMAGVSIDLARVAIVDPLTALLAGGAFAALATKRANTITVLVTGAAIGLLHAWW